MAVQPGLVGNPEDRFSHNEAQMSQYLFADCSAYHCYNYGTFDVDTCQCSCYNSLGFYAGDPCVCK